MKNQNGSVSLIVIIFTTIIIATITVSTNIGFLFLQKQNLQELIDQAALSGVQEIDLTSYYQNGLTKELKLDKSEATLKVQEFILRNSKFEDEVRSKIVFSQGEISVNGEVSISPPLVANLVKFPIRASASARFVVGF